LDFMHLDHVGRVTMSFPWKQRSTLQLQSASGMQISM
jgi:hypothetical protein